jgi:formylglycine-generating enzyme required for sulfatase activity
VKRLAGFLLLVRCSTGGSSSDGELPLPPRSQLDGTHEDGKRNLDETDVDCGGRDAKRCDVGRTCVVGPDCITKVCNAGVCAPPSATDGQQNGDETDVDCGGTSTNAPRCGPGKACNAHADCASDGCAYDKKCAEGRSCTLHHGGDTCGPDGAPESCCKSLEVPRAGSPYKLDKYAITAGRLRALVERTNGDLRGWFEANKPAGWDPAWNAFLPKQLDDGTYVSHEGVYQELGPGLFYGAGTGNQGCDVERFGARTYRIPDDRSRALWNEVQHYPQEVMDEKALQCATFFVFAAVCAFDGARLPTRAELDYAWTGGAPTLRRYPWGNTPIPAGFDASYTNIAEAQGTGSVAPGGGDITMASFNFNWWSPPDRVCGTGWCDWTVHVPPPGRFPKGNGPYGHSDLAGLLINVTSEVTGTGDWASRRVYWGRNGMWEGPNIPYYGFSDAAPALPTIAKYRSLGARCAR